MKKLLASLNVPFPSFPYIAFFFGIYLAVVVAGAYQHEMWRDEVRALSLAIESHSLPDLFAHLKNEGHPGLWHVLLYLCYRLFHTPLVLPAVSLAAAAVALFLWKSPFPFWQKLLFAFGVFPLHEYSIAKALGNFLNARAQYRNAILLGEPDYLLESLPYYAPNPIYAARESRFGKTVRFTLNAKPQLSLAEWLAAGEAVVVGKGETGGFLTHPLF